MKKKKNDDNLYLLASDSFRGGATYQTINMENNLLILQANLVFDLNTKTGTKLAKEYLSEMITTQLTPVIKKLRKYEKGNKIRKETTYHLPQIYIDKFFSDEPKVYTYNICRHYRNTKEIIFTTSNLQEAKEIAIKLCKTLNIKVTIYENGILFQEYKTDRCTM